MLVLATQVILCTVPTAVVVAHAVVLCQSADVGAPCYALVVVPASGRSIFEQPQDGLGILLASLQQVAVALHHADGVQPVAPDVTAERNGEETAILVRHLYQLGKEGDTRLLRARTFVARIIETPELLGVVPAEEVGIGLEEVFKCLQVVVLDVGMSATGGLTGEPHAILLAHRSPRPVGADGIARHLIDLFLGVVLTREAQVHADKGLHVLGYQVDDFLRVGSIPYVDVNHPQRVL